MKFSSTIADIRQLCCMGLDGPTIMPVLFELIEQIAPSRSQLFVWADRNYDIANMYSPELPSMANVARLYLEEFVNKKEKEAMPPFAEIMRTMRGSVAWERFQNRRFFRSEFFNTVLRPLEARHVLGTVIHNRERALGELVLWRAPRERPYSEREAQALASLIPYIAHAINVRPSNKLEFVEAPNRGLAVVNRKGEVEHACPQAQQLLFWATHPQVASPFAHRPSKRSLPPPVAKLMTEWTRVADDAATPAPALYHDNPWGRFKFWIYRLDHVGSDRDALFGVTIEREQPIALVLWARMKSYGLSLRQKEVCQLLVLGYTYADIAKRLGIQPHTVVDYVRALYEKLDVRNRVELVKKFCTEMNPKSG